MSPFQRITPLEHEPFTKADSGVRYDHSGHPQNDRLIGDMTLLRNIRSALVTACWPLLNRVQASALYAKFQTPDPTFDMERLVRGTNRWREWYNPLRGLTVARAVTLLECAQRGEF